MLVLEGVNARLIESGVHHDRYKDMHDFSFLWEKYEANKSRLVGKKLA
jgi:hypothetical protein